MNWVRCFCNFYGLCVVFQKIEYLLSVCLSLLQTLFLDERKESFWNVRPLGTFMFGFITSRLGCKRAMLFLAIPSIIFWVLVFFGNSYYYILIARFFTGQLNAIAHNLMWSKWIIKSTVWFVVGWTGGGASIATQIYISEISNDKWAIIFRATFSQHSKWPWRFFFLLKFARSSQCDHSTRAK